MPWKEASELECRVEFIRRMQEAGQTIASLCRQFGVSRKTAHKWHARYRREGLRGLQSRSRRPRHSPGRHTARCREAVRAARMKWPRWGAKKLRELLRRAHPRWRLPAVSTISCWLRQWSLVRGRRRRAKRGPTLPRAPLSAARAPNQVWTVDFKGWFRTGDGQRCEPLTIRDLCSRYGLTVDLLADQSHRAVQPAMKKLFRRRGLPRVIRADNGAPFAGSGPLGLSRLSVWWLRLGIRVEFTRRARPGDNSSHEQMHRILKADTARPPARTRRAQQRRTSAWLNEYNHVRPHEALQQATPASLYRNSARALPGTLPALQYPRHWMQRRVRAHGDIKWQGRLRFVGRAFVGERVGLKPCAAQVVQVYLGRQLIGTLHEQDRGGMRPARWERCVPAVPQRGRKH